MIQLGPDERGLPLELASEKVAVVGLSGSGKTTLAAVMVEELHAAGVRVLVLDMMGEWWGLRGGAGLSGDEQTATGLPFYIFGGDRADVPVAPGMAGELGAVLAESTFSAVVDGSRLRPRDRTAFYTALLVELYERNRAPLHVVLDEADLFAPQTTDRPGSKDLRDAVADLVRRGRKRGFGVTMVTQRPAEVAKSVLSQAETIFVARLAGEHDLGAIDRWIRHVPAERREWLLHQLPTLPTGEAWAITRHWPERAGRVRVRPRRTYDAGKTPKVGTAAGPPPRLTPVEVAALAERLRPPSVDGPTEPPPTGGAPDQRMRDLAERVRHLEEALAQERAKPPKEVPVLAATERKAVEDLRDRLSELLQRVPAPVPAPVHRERAAPGPAKVRSEPAARSPAKPDGKHIPAGGRRIAHTLVRMDRPLPRSELATLSGFSASSGTFSKYLSMLAAGGYILASTPVAVTTDGRCKFPCGAAGPITLAEVRGLWRFVGKANDMLDYIIAVGEQGINRTDLAARVGMTHDSGTFTKYLSTIRRAGFLAVPHGALALAPFLRALPR